MNQSGKSSFRIILIIALISVCLLIIGKTISYNIIKRNPEPEDESRAPHHPATPIPVITWKDALAKNLKENPAYGAKSTPVLSGMIRISAGAALVGCKSNCQETGRKQTKVTLPSYYIDKHPVTWNGFGECVKARMCLPVEPNRDVDLGGDYPAILDFDSAERYCTWQGKRLPSEDEWEKAARGTKGRRYPWGDDPPAHKMANICDFKCTMPFRDAGISDGYRFTSPVGTFPAGNSPYGLADMAGNVKEWVSTPSPDPTATHVAKGSSWYSTPAQTAVYVRQDWRPGVRLDDKGVRCVYSKAKP